MSALHDTLGRPLGSLRVSVTDRCNIRCAYCMPEDEYVWLPKPSILTFEEIARLAGVFASLGASKVRLTGGEPLLRHELPLLIARLASQSAIHDLALTTNGTLLERFARPLREAGLGRLTVSLDTLRPERYVRLSRADRLRNVLAGLDTALAEGFAGTKINTVVMRGVNDDEIVDLVAFGRDRGVEVRFIEYMDVGGATQWRSELVVPRREILERVAQALGPVRDVAGDDPHAPADRFTLPDGTTFGVIASTTAPFCRTCDRARLTADGMLFLCLYARDGIDLKALLRGGATDAAIVDRVHAAWSARADRGAELRAETPGRSVLYQLDGLRSDPHREMHTRGG